MSLEAPCCRSGAGCLLRDGGTGSPIYPRTPDELSLVLRQIFEGAREP